MGSGNCFIIDFDSTFVQVEVMDELACVALRDSANRDEIVSLIKEITRLGMEGKIPFDESLERRVALLSASKSHVDELINQVAQKISVSIEKNRAFFWTNRENVYIISGGFKEIIVPIVKSFGIPHENVFANTFVFDSDGNITGVDTVNLLSQEGGKVKQVASLSLTGFVYVIGDGYTDYQIKEAGLANKFVAFTENVKRPNVIEKADFVASTFDDFLALEELSGCCRISRCSDRM